MTTGKTTLGCGSGMGLSKGLADVMGRERGDAKPTFRLGTRAGVRLRCPTDRLRQADSRVPVLKLSQ